MDKRALLGGLLALLLSTTATARSVSYTYHPDTLGPDGSPVPGQLASVDGPRTDVADVTRYDYDARGNLIRVTNALGHVTAINAHDASGRPLTLIDPNGVLTELTYDARGRLTQRRVDGASTDYTYDPAGNLTAVTSPTGVVVYYDYDDAHRLIALRDGRGNRIDYTLDAAGNRTEEQILDPSGVLRYARTQVFDELSRLREVIAPGGGSERYAYDAAGNLTEQVDGSDDPTHFDFDALDRLAVTTDALAGQTVYAYDAGGRLASVTDPRGNATRYDYDGLGNLITLTSPDTGTTHYAYDAAGHRTREEDAKGRVIEYQYDALNRMSAMRFPAAPAENVTFTYDEGAYGIGRLTAITDSSGTTRYAYSARGQLVRETREQGGLTFSVGYGYDAAGQLTSMTYPSGRVIEYVRDELGQVQRIVSRDAGESTTVADGIHYAPFGPLEGLTYGNGLLLTRQYDQRYRLTALQAGGALGQAYRYYGDDNVQAISDLTGTGRDQSFSYDPLDRLNYALGSYGSRGYDYDGVGNRTALTTDTEALTYTSESASNRLLEILSPSATTAVRYDESGNIVQKGALSFTYDSLNRMTRAYRNGERVGQYAYNALGQRVYKEAQSAGPDYAAMAQAAASQAQAKREEAAGLAAQAATAVAEAVAKDDAANAQTQDAQAKRAEAEALKAQAAALEAEAQPYLDKAERARTRLADQRARAEAKGGKHLVRFDERSAPRLEAQVERWEAEAEPLLDEARALRTQAAILIAQAAELERQAQRLLAEAEGLRAQAAALSAQAEGLEAEAVVLEAKAAEYAALAEEQPKVIVATRYVYDASGQLIAEVDAQSGRTRVEYVWLGGMPVAQVVHDTDGASLYYIHADHLDTPKAVTDGAGEVVWAARHKPFGEAEVTTGDVVMNLRFPGQYFDEETGLHYNWHRYYDPSTGRYVTSLEFNFEPQR